MSRRLTRDQKRLTFFGSYNGPAVNEPDCTVVAHAFGIAIDGLVTASAEIEELAWIDPRNPGPIVLAPLTRDEFLPLLQAESDRPSTLPAH